MSAPNRVFIIAEAGVNHNGSLGTARRLIDVAKRAGADAVKFQTFSAHALVTRTAPKARYQTRVTGKSGSQLDMLRRLELSQEAHGKLAAYCRRKRIEFMSTPFDEESLEFLVGNLNMRRIKIASGEITNAPLLLCAARSGRPVILSTGMSTLDEVAEALGVLAFGYTQHGRPGYGAFRRALRSNAGRRALAAKLTLLHCVSNYPARTGEMNLRAMDTLAATFQLPVGLSDHTLGTTVSIAAAARGAVAIEKHFTLDRTLPGPDHQASLEPEDLEAMVGAIRDVGAALGTGVKLPTRSERSTRRVARRSLVALTDIRRGERLTAANLGAKRPGSGVSPAHYYEYLGQPARRDYRKDAPIKQ